MECTTIDEEEEVSWTVWQTINTKMMLQTISGLIASLLWEIDNRWPVFLHRAFINCQQHKYIETIREQSSADDYVVVQIDFAENYKFVWQREPQGAHWNTDQATLFTIHFKIGKEHRCMVVISDYMNHDSKFVWLAQENIVNFVKKQYPRVKQINYVRYIGIKIFFYSIVFNILSSNDAASHFKNNYTLMNLLYHKKDFDVEAAWTFSATGYGKGPCDGIGVAVKAIAARATLQGHPNTSFQTVLDSWSFTFDKNHRSQLDESSPLECCFLPKERVQKIYREILEKRWDRITSSSKHLQITSYGIDRIFFQTNYQVSENTINSILNWMKQYLAEQYRCRRIISITVINNDFCFMVISSLCYPTFTSVFWDCFDIVSHSQSR